MQISSSQLVHTPQKTTYASLQGKKIGRVLEHDPGHEFLVILN